MENVIIYTLSGPRDNAVKYVGKTTNVKRRFSEHIKESGTYKKIRWIQKLAKLNLIPIMEEIDCVPRSEEDFWEIYWISQFKTWGIKLLNHTKGGHNPPITRKYGNDNAFKKDGVREKIEAMNRARKGKTFEELYGVERARELKEKLSERTKGNNNPRYGAILSEEHKEKISQANSGERNGMFGKTLTSEHIEKLRKINTNKIVSEETRNKMRVKKLGVKLSIKTRNKIKLALMGGKNVNYKGLVYQYDKQGNLIKTWQGLYEIKEIYGQKFSNICSCITGKLKSAYGYIWTRKKPDNAGFINNISI